MQPLESCLNAYQFHVFRSLQGAADIVSWMKCFCVSIGMIWRNGNITSQVGGNSSLYSAFFQRHTAVKFAAFILQNAFCWPTILAKNKAQKQAIGRRFLPYGLLFQSIFKNTTCILHHFAFLFGRQLANFSRPIKPFQTLKPHFLTTILPFFILFLMVLRGFIYTIVVNIYAYRPAFSSILPCVQHQNALRLAPKRIVFSTKTHCIQHQNALHLAPKCRPFSTKTHHIQRQTTPKVV